jgi:mxaJ protein
MKLHGGHRVLGLLAVIVLAMAGSADLSGPPVLHVCADPNNLPFSNDRLEGFENRIAALAGRDLGMRVEYTWWAQRRGFLRNTLNAALCDVVVGLPSGMDGALTTRPYYRSSYVSVSRRDRRLRLGSLDDEALEHLTIGVQLVGDDGANSPPAHVLSRRGLTRNIVGFSVLGDYATANPPARIIDAVSRGEVDVAMAWGPMAGYFAARQPVPLDVVPLAPTLKASTPALPLTFDIAMAVRRGDSALRYRLDGFVARRAADLGQILAEYHVPLVEAGER